MDFRFETMLRRKQSIMFNTSENSSLPISYIMSFDKNLESLGYCLSPECIEAMRSVDPKRIKKLYDETVEVLLGAVGGDVTHKPMYKNFPASVMDAEYAELLYDQIVGYIVDAVDTVTGSDPSMRDEISFDGDEIKRLDVEKRKALKPISPAYECDFIAFCRNLIGGKTAMSSDDKAIVAKSFELGYSNIIPSSIPFKENLAFVASLINRYPQTDVSEIRFATATDVLRLATAFSNGDISLASNTKYKLDSRQRRIVLSLMNDVAIHNSRAVEDMLRNRERFVRLAEILHPHSEVNCKKFPAAASVFMTIRDKKAVRSFSSKVEAAIRNGDIAVAVNLLSGRPGEFIRRLDVLLRTSLDVTTQNLVLDKFEEITDKISTPLLLTVRTLFISRSNANEADAIRVAFPKGSVCKAYSYSKPVGEIPAAVCDRVVRICEEALCKNYAEKEPLGKVYLSDELKNFVVPFATRSESKTARTITRGSRVKVDEASKVLRSFIYWKGRDVDLSACVIDSDLNWLTHISFTHLKEGDYAVHSGDITYAPNGASEFIDFDLEKLKEAYPSSRYIVFNIISYSGETFAQIPQCFFGAMSRESMLSGEIYEPSTVDFKVEFDSPYTTMTPAIFDLETMEYIWVDMPFGSGIGNTIEGNMNANQSAIYSVLNINRPNLYDLFALHIKARNGELVDDINDADTVFSTTVGITPYDKDVIVSEYI